MYKVKKCVNFYDRLMGLMFKKEILFFYLFPKCNSIHTFFMLNNIDVYMTDKDNNILYIYRNLKPNRIILPKKKVYNVYETKAGLLDYKIGEKMNLD